MTYVKRTRWLLSHVLKEPRKRRRHEIQIRYFVVSEAMTSARNHFSFEQSLQVCKSGTTQIRSVWNNTQKRHAPHVHKCSAHVMLRLLVFVELDFVNDNSSNIHAVLLTQHSIQLQLIKRTSEPSICHQNTIGSKHTGNLCVACTNDASHSGMARPLAEDDVAPVIDIAESGNDIIKLLIQSNFSIDELFGITRTDHAGRHGWIRTMVKLEMLAYQDNILVDPQCVSRITLDFQVLLTDRLDEADLVKPLGEARHERKGRRGLPNMLLGSRDVDGTSAQMLDTLRRRRPLYPFPVIHAHWDGIGGQPTCCCRPQWRGVVAIPGVGQRVRVSCHVSGGECPMRLALLTLA
mmetsp:Transcript_17526/g.50157  ORF Transcript_17526/g.50157 Transcript_17526/m.50157 type:complete len:349 (-) Transcript_17526:202-1248(-)